MLDIRKRTGYLFLAVMLGHVILISAQAQNRGGVRLLSAATFGVMSRIQLASAGGVDKVRGIWQGYFWLRGARAENEHLKRLVVELEGRLEEQRARVNQTAALEELLALRKSLPVTTIAARVIAGDPTPGFPAVTIDKGSADGVRANMAVIGPRGVVGRIFVDRLAEHSAQVQLIVGKYTGTSAYLEKSGAGGDVTGGHDDPPLRMEGVPNHVTVSVGELVLSAGVDGIYPRGYTIGRVEHVDRASGIFEIKVRPTVDFSNLQYVLVLTTPPSPRWADEPDPSAKPPAAPQPGTGRVQ